LHHPKLFGALILSLLPAYNVYLIGAGIPSVDPVHLGFLAFFVFAIAIYAALTIREGARELRALRTACERIYPQPREAVPPLFPVNQARSLPPAAGRFNRHKRRSGIPERQGNRFACSTRRTGCPS